MTGAETLWLNVTNIALGVATIVLCIATLAVIAVELRSRWIGRAAGPPSAPPRPRPRRPRVSVALPPALPAQRFICGDDAEPADGPWPGTIPPPAPPRPERPGAWLN